MRSLGHQPIRFFFAGFSRALLVAFALNSVAAGQGTAPSIGERSTVVCAECIRANLEFLASDGMKGRGSGSEEEHIAALYAASELQRAGIAAAGIGAVPTSQALDSYVQPVLVRTQAVTRLPEIRFRTGKRTVKLIQGKDFHVFRMTAPELAGKLYKQPIDEKTSATSSDAFVLVTMDSEPTAEQIRSQQETLTGKAAAILVPVPARLREQLLSALAESPSLPSSIEGVTQPATQRPIVIYLGSAAFKQFKSLPDGLPLLLTAPVKDTPVQTRNVVGILRGTDPKLANEAILLSAHLDHLGTGKPVHGDAIYNGADDDASGVTAVLEIARALGSQAPRRTVIFALFGSEEKGLWGSTYFREHSPAPLENIVANLAFEMIARPDPAVSQNSLWLTGWDRSNLGPQLAAQGANLVPDPHPEEHFFERSDNYALATKGVVAHTVSSYGLHKDYHQPSDDLSHVDWEHLIGSIASMIQPVQWLANSDFRPEWVQGKKPSE